MLDDVEGTQQFGPNPAGTLAVGRDEKGHSLAKAGSMEERADHVRGKVHVGDEEITIRDRRDVLGDRDDVLALD